MRRRSSTAEEALARAIAKALPLEGKAAEAAGARLAHYLSDCVRAFELEPYAALAAGTVRFPHMSSEGVREG